MEATGSTHMARPTRWVHESLDAVTSTASFSERWRVRSDCGPRRPEQRSRHGRCVWRRPGPADEDLQCAVDQRALRAVPQLTDAEPAVNNSTGVVLWKQANVALTRRARAIWAGQTIRGKYKSQADQDVWQACVGGGRSSARTASKWAPPRGGAAAGGGRAVDGGDRERVVAGAAGRVRVGQVFERAWLELVANLIGLSKGSSSRRARRTTCVRALRDGREEPAEPEGRQQHGQRGVVELAVAAGTRDPPARRRLNCRFAEHRRRLIGVLVVECAFTLDEKLLVLLPLAPMLTEAVRKIEGLIIDGGRSSIGQMMSASRRSPTCRSPARRDDTSSRTSTLGKSSELATTASRWNKDLSG